MRRRWLTVTVLVVNGDVLANGIHGVAVVEHTTAGDGSSAIAAATAASGPVWLLARH